MVPPRRQLWQWPPPAFPPQQRKEVVPLAKLGWGDRSEIGAGARLWLWQDDSAPIAADGGWSWFKTRVLVHRFCVIFDQCTLVRVKCASLWVCVQSTAPIHSKGHHFTFSATFVGEDAKVCPCAVGARWLVGWLRCIPSPALRSGWMVWMPLDAIGWRMFRHNVAF